MTTSGEVLGTRASPADPAAPSATAHVAPSTRHRFVGRQPILTLSGRVFGHEYLYRTGNEQTLPVDRWSPAAQDRATLRVLEAAFGTREPVRSGIGPLAFVNFTRSFLVADLPVPAMAGQLVVEIVESVRADAAVVAGVARLREKGFRIAVDDFVGLESQLALLPFADYVKVDLRDLRRRGPDLLSLARSQGGVLIAERVETRLDRDLCRAAGFSLFQGDHLGPAELLEWSTAERSLRRVHDQHTLLAPAPPLAVERLEGGAPNIPIGAPVNPAPRSR